MSDTPEISENLEERIEAHRAALATLPARTEVTARPAAAEGAPPRADVLISSDANPWQEGRTNREEREESKEEEKKSESD
ncbi:hypothetical protein [Streptomyces sp. NPDC002265]|uniref:hypothetical protein n=1 Tax=Streptomyces sp. NPDC002265 TaxID=3154415 RepID=UPI003317414B